VDTTDLEAYYFENDCTNDIWMKAIEEEMHSIQKNDT